MGQTEEEAGALHEGVPPWMERPLFAWLALRTTRRTGAGVVRMVEFVDEFDQLRRAEFPVAEDFRQFGSEVFKDRWRNVYGEYTETLFHFLDYCVAYESLSDRVSREDL